MELRYLRLDEKELLKDFLYEAIFIPDGVEPPAREIIEQPELKLYYEGFGTGRADYCIVADDEMPSFAISLEYIRVCEL